MVFQTSVRVAREIPLQITKISKSRMRH